MLSFSQLSRAKMYKRVAVDSDKLVYLGKIHHGVFAPHSTRLVGFMIKRPDIICMIKRSDLFMALDSFAVSNDSRYDDNTGAEVLFCDNPAEGLGDVAIKRLGLDWNQCVMWFGMDVMTQSHKNLGRIVDFTFSPHSGEVEHFEASTTQAATALIGNVMIAPQHVNGCKKQTMIVSDEVGAHSFSGGVAGKVGEAVGKVQVHSTKACKTFMKHAEKGVEKGSHSLGRALGKAKRAVVETTQLDAKEPQLEALDVEVLAPEATKQEATRSAGHSDEKTAKSETASAARSDTTSTTSIAKPETSDTPDETSVTTQAARACGRQISRSKGMFSAFKEEFINNSK